jgi:coatomer subunit delta
MWPSPVGDGSSDVNLEYEIDGSAATLEDVVITIPLPIPGSMPDIREIDGTWQVTAAGFEWRPPVDQVDNGRLEFNVGGDDAEGFFPVEVRYRTTSTVCTVDVIPVQQS